MGKQRKRAAQAATLTEQIEQQEQAALLRSAQAKGLKNLNASEKAAVRRHEEGTFLRVLGSCSKALVLELIGSASKTVIDNADRRGFPWPKGKRDRVDLGGMLQWLWRYFLEHPVPDATSGGLTEDDVLLVGASQELKDEFLRQRIVERRLVNRQKEIELVLLEESHVPTEKVETFAMAMAEVTRKKGENAQRTFEKRFGSEAAEAVQELFSDMADAWERRSVNEFGGDGSDDEEHEPAA